MIGLNDVYAKADDPESGKPDIPALVESIFCPGGWLEKHLRLDHRPQQSSMAQETIDAWVLDEALLFEAGTGVGKGIAYLMPGILQAVSSDRPLVVSTHTIALQEQIQGKDLELCRKLFTASEELKPYRSFRHAILLGRANYLCGARLRNALKSRTELFPSNEQTELNRIATWAQSTKTGLLQELDPFPLRKFGTGSTPTDMPATAAIAHQKPVFSGRPGKP